MESFAKLMSTIGASHSGVDFIAGLPVELAELILLKLDPRSLLNAVQVSKKWMAVCVGSSRLRRISRRHLRKEKKRMMPDLGFLARQSRTEMGQIVSGSSRRRADLAERISRREAPPSLVFRSIRIKRPDTLKKRSGDKNPGYPFNVPTRSSLRLR